MINLIKESTPNLYCLISDHQYDHEKTIRKATKEELLKLAERINKQFKMKVKSTNAYIIYNKEINDIGDMLFSKKKEAIAYIRGIAYQSKPEVMAQYLKIIKKKYKIIKIEMGTFDIGDE